MKSLTSLLRDMPDGKQPNKYAAFDTHLNVVVSGVPWLWNILGVYVDTKQKSAIYLFSVEF